MPEVKWYSLKDISEELGLHIETLREYVRDKKLVAYRFGRDYRVKAEDYQKFIEERRAGKDDDN